MTLHASDEEAIDTIDAAFFSGDTFEKKENLERIEYFLARWLRKTNEIRANLKQEPLIMESRNGAHTPGPWVCSSDGWIDTNDGGEIMAYAGCGTHEAYIENPYDRALILAAPELLAALKHMVACHYPDANGQMGAKEECWDSIQNAQAAIEKATTPVDEK